MRVVRAVGAVAVGLATGAALVSAHGGDRQRIHACVDNFSPQYIRIVDAHADCSQTRGDDRPEDWNIRGAAGPPGPAGPEGGTGPSGPAGVPGLDAGAALRTVVQTGDSRGSGLETQTARCAPGEFAVSGGWNAMGGSSIAEFNPYQNRPAADGSAWTAKISAGYVTPDKPWRLVVFAVCARAVGG